MQAECSRAAICVELACMVYVCYCRRADGSGNAPL